MALFVDTVGKAAGTERQVVETARRLDKQKFDVHVCCLEPSAELSALNSCCNTQIFSFTRIVSSAALTQLAAMRRYLHEHEIDIVHAFMNKTSICAVATSLGSDRIVITSRLNTGYWYTPFLKRAFRVLNLATGRVMANSNEAKRIAVEAEKLDPAMVDVVYQGVNMDVYRPGAGDPEAARRLGIPEGSRVVGIVANLRPVKDIPLFLRAAKLVSEKIGDAVFLIAGGGEQYGELVELVQNLGLRDRVFFTRGEGRVLDWLSCMSIGCLTSQSEGFSNAILEYMAMALPVVATCVGGNAEAVVDGQTGYLIRERTAEAIAAPVIELLRNENLRRSMGERGAKRCRENFEWGRTILNLEQYYTALTFSHRAKRRSEPAMPATETNPRA